MKKVLSTVITASLVMGMMAPTAFGASQSFVDIEKSYAKDAIVELQSMGILNGMDDTHFNPKGTLTRAQFVAIIVRTLGLDAPEVASSFTDVKGWATAVIEAASKAGIIEGVGNGKFAPNGLLTREAAATILVRALQLKGEVTEGGELTFTDANKISAWAKPFIAIAQHYGLIKGNPDGTFNPKGSANREMAAMMGMNLLGAFDEVKAPDTTPPVTPVDPKPDDTTTPPTTGGGSGGGGGGGGWYSPTYYVQSITVAAAADSIATKGGTLQMTAAILPTYATNANVTWSVSNDNATISSAGLLTAVKDGTVTVKATAVDGSGVAGTKVITVSDQTTTTPPVEDADTTAPVITLNGESVVELVYGAEYVDAGATATDNKDGDIAVVVTISNEAGEATTAIDTTVAGAYTYHYNVSDAAGNAAVEVTRTVTVAAEVVIPPVEEEDTTVPVIELIGHSVVDVVYNATYVDAGATAFDTKDGDLSDSITITITNDALEVIPTVTTTVYGAYTYHYNVIDAAGNEAEEVTRTVNVAAEVIVPPVYNPTVIDNVYIKSSNVTNSVYAAVGDTITLTFTTAEQVSKLSNFKINGSNPTTFVSELTGDIWTNTATYVIEESDPSGIMTFQINVKNAAGLYSVTTEATTDGSSVRVLKQTVISSVYLSSSNVIDSVYAAVGDEVTLSFTTDVEVSPLGNFKINGSNPTTFDSVQTGDIWNNTATYIVEESDPNGVMSFQINVKNAAGIYSVTTEATTDGSSVTVSKDAPIITGATLVADGPDRVILQFQTNENIDLGTAGDLKIRFFNVHDVEAVKDGLPIVKDKTWSGYLLDGLNTKYSIGTGTDKDDDFINVLPADTTLYTTITSGYDYANSEWYNDIAYVTIEATDDLGNTSVISVQMPE